MDGFLRGGEGISERRKVWQKSIQEHEQLVDELGWDEGLGNKSLK